MQNKMRMQNFDNDDDDDDDNDTLNQYATAECV